MKKKEKQPLQNGRITQNFGNFIESKNGGNTTGNKFFIQNTEDLIN